MQRFFDSEDDVESFLKLVPSVICPHCGATGPLSRHGYIRGFAGLLFGIRGWRVFCDPDSARGKGCGRTLTLRLSGTLPGRSLSAAALSRFMLGLFAGLSVWKAWRNADTGMSIRTGYRIFRRLEHRQSEIRTGLFGLSPPPLEGKEKTPLSVTLKILKEALGINAVSEYQKKRQSAFL
jgi:hypothetical protein